MKNLKHLILSPWILSLAPFTIVVLLIHQGFHRYQLEIRSTSDMPEGSYVWFDDLDNDGTSEKIYSSSKQNSTSLAISDKNGIKEQWNFRGSVEFQFRKKLAVTGDFDSDHIKEVCFFTLSYDSVLLHIISDFNNPILLVKNRLVAVAGKGMETPDPFLIPAGMEDLDGDGFKELIFGIGSGFSQFPRNIFAYYLGKDSLVMSPRSGYYIWDILQADINGDGKREMFPYGYAASNIRPDEALYHDCKAFLMALDKRMRFLFKPVGMGGKYSKITPFLVQGKVPDCIGFLYNSASSGENSKIYYVNCEGIQTDSLQLPFYSIDCLNTSLRDKEMYLLTIPGMGLGLFDRNFRKKKIVNMGDGFNIIQADFDSDRRKEIFVSGHEKGEITLFREGLKHPVSVKIPFAGKSDYLFSLRLLKGSETEISLQSGKNHLILVYRQNPAYPFYYLFYLVIYTGILGFAMLIKKIQKDQIRKKYENEKKISQLQLSLIRNQLDPHFTLNAISSIIYSVEHLEKDKAGDQLRRFANLYRNLLLSAGSNRRSIREELDFCSDYLTLEKNRFGDKFSYSISVEDEVDTEFLIPKMLIQLHVENAIKHGLATLKSDGLLEVTLRKQEKILLIDIKDNGIGRVQSAKNEKTTTGKGLEIMDELYYIYNKYYNEKISSELTDLYDRDGRPAGTRVVIKIMSKND